MSDTTIENAPIETADADQTNEDIVEATEESAEGEEDQAEAETEAAAEPEAAATEEEDEAAKAAKRLTRPEDPASFQKRINTATREKYDAMRRADEASARAADLEARLKAIEVEKDPEAAKNDPATLRAQIRAEIEAETQQRRIADAANRTFDKGVEAHSDFESARDELVKTFGHVLVKRGDFIEAVTELDNGHDVFYHLGKNLNEADRLLSLSPARMGLELGKLAVTLAVKPAPKPPAPLSAAPAPIRPIVGSAKADATDPEKMSPEQYAAWRRKTSPFWQKRA